MNISIVGSGSWGTALAIHLGTIGHNIKIWSFTEEERDKINNEHKCLLLPNANIPENVYCTTSLEEAVENTEIILHVTPSKFTRSTIEKYKQYVKDQIVVICSKGFEKESLKTLDEVAKEELPNSKIAVLSGPSHAEEVSLEVPTALVVASNHEEVNDLIQKEFTSDHLRIYTCMDVKGVELGGALKNIIAFCAGVAAGIGLRRQQLCSTNHKRTKRNCRTSELHFGGEKETFYGLTGLRRFNSNLPK